MNVSTRRTFIGAALASSSLALSGVAGERDGAFVELPPSDGPLPTEDACMKVRFLGTGAADWDRAPRTGRSGIAPYRNATRMREAVQHANLPILLIL